MRRSFSPRQHRSIAIAIATIVVASSLIILSRVYTQSRYVLDDQSVSIPASGAPMFASVDDSIDVDDDDKCRLQILTMHDMACSELVASYAPGMGLFVNRLLVISGILDTQTMATDNPLEFTVRLSHPDYNFMFFSDRHPLGMGLIGPGGIFTGAQLSGDADNGGEEWMLIRVSPRLGYTPLPNDTVDIIVSSTRPFSHEISRTCLEIGPSAVCEDGP
ncbi:hypothetical protein FWH13_00090 [Candidatus Saccharibacteria bacterium]|nr:hypothetical protein [Candidatus Saccharibacteria bacterium]